MVFNGSSRRFENSPTVLIFFALFAFFFVSVLKAERLPVKTYTIADGLLRDNVYKIKQDSRGFLWFTTVEGVSRFDGYAFTNFTTADGLPDRRVNDFLETRDGTIYIATDRGLARLNPIGVRAREASSAANQNGSLFTAFLPVSERAFAINILFEDEDGTVFAGTSDGLYRLTLTDGETKLESVNLGGVPDGEPLEIRAIIKDRKGAMWIGSGNGIFRIAPGGAVERFDKKSGLPDVSISVIYEDRNGRIWVGLRPNQKSGLLLLVAEPHENQNIVERHYHEKDGLPADWVTALSESSGGKFWVGTTRGLCEWQGEGGKSVCRTYTAKNGLCDKEIWTLIEDKDDNLWAGTRCGVMKWTRYGFTTYTEADGTGDTLANSIFENSAGELFASFNNGTSRTVSRFDGEKFELVKPHFPSDIIYFGWGWKQTARQDRGGDWWFPTAKGLYRFRRPVRFADLSKTAPQKISFGEKGNETFRFYEDSRGDFWVSTIGTAFELWHHQRAENVWQNVSNEAGISQSRIATAFVEDARGNLWIGTGSDANDTALIRYRDGNFKVYTRADSELLAGWIRDLYVDHADRLWITDTETSVLRLDDPESERLDFKRYTPAEGLSSVGVSCITEDAFGRIYIGTGRGLDRLTPESGQIENFTTADGLPSSSVEIAYRDRHSDLWFGTTGGLTRLSPKPERARKPPNVLITGLRVSGESQNISVLGESSIKALELNSDQKQVSIDFLGLGASLGERLKYEYRLAGADWIPANERTVNFANLAAGEYKFEIRAQTADRIYSQPALVAFRIAAPFWQRPWFIASAVILTALAIYFFYKTRLARLLEMERMRTRIATDLHDDIGANLTRISLLSEVASRQAAGENGKKILPSIAEIARESVASMNDIVWAISPEHDSLIDLTRRMRRHAEEVFVLRDIELVFNAPDSDLRLSIGVRRDVLLIFKEAVNNAAKHSNCSRVAIDFRCEHSALRLRIEDDGKGFDPKNMESYGQGLRSMARRANALGGDLTIKSKSTGGGTIVRFEMPLSPRRRA
ncbi:MAG TPA: two-component regulator propeller domain-containing protein [Pyrinomonadaceae bacterium]|nr:two-component regulator propeller domain-containing protein [Pyrinomonadaceae bacterium]